MSLGRSWESMAHQDISPKLKEHELWAEREAAARRIGETAAYLASVMDEFGKARDNGDVPDDLWRINENAHKDSFDATCWLVDVNQRIREAGL